MEAEPQSPLLRGARENLDSGYNWLNTKILS